MTGRFAASLAFAVGILSPWQDLRPHSSGISGTVVSIDQQPIAGAVVTAQRSGDQHSATVLSDSVGRFDFGSLPAGRYQVRARRPPYLETAYGAVAFPGPGVEVFLSAGGTIADLSIAMPRGGVITGVVRFLDGTPASDVSVEIHHATHDGSLAVAGRVVMDDRGAYRAFGLPPGTYYVAVTTEVVESADT